MAAEYNFNLPLDLSKLQNERMKLVPFDSDLPRFAHLYATLTSASPAARDNFAYLPYGPFTTADEFLAWYVPAIQARDNVVWFAIMVQGKWRKDEQQPYQNRNDDGDFAGTIAYLNSDPANASCENGHLNILPRYQRSFVNTHANGLLLQYALNPPSQGGLGLRRMQWFANAANERSQAAARRLGFVFEGVLRWHRTLPPGKISAGAEKGREPGDGRGGARHSALLSLCWDDWVDGARENIKTLMER